MKISKTVNSCRRPGSLMTRSVQLGLFAPLSLNLTTPVGLVAPRGTPPAAVETLSLAVAAVLQDASIAARLRDAGIAR